MDVFDAIGQAMNGDSTRSKRTPVCILSNYPDLQERMRFFDKRKDDVAAQADALEKAWGEEHKAFWADYEKELVAKGLITQEESGPELGLSIRDGVLFKFSEKKA